MQKLEKNIENNLNKSAKIKAAQHKNNKAEPHRVRKWFFRYRWYLLVGLVVPFLLWWMGATHAAAPGDIGYPIKRAFEDTVTFFTFSQHTKDDLRATNAEERVEESSMVADRVSNESPEKQVTDSQTIQNLLKEYMESYSASTTGLSQDINKDTKFDNNDLNNDLNRDANAYTLLMKLRLEAPPAAQAAVLQSINLLQSNIATIQDALHAAPVTPDDSNELSKLVSQGFLTREELTKLLASTTSNRQLLDSLRNLVRNGQLPSTATYAISYDLVNKFVPKQAALFTASINFDEMNKVAIFAQTITPTPEQKQATQKYLANYKFGDQLPRDVSTRAFVMPLVYGLNLTPNLSATLNNLDLKELSPIRKALYDAWKPLATNTASQDTKQLYSQALKLAGAATTRSVTLMEQVQLEMLNAVRANIAYLALPPGWTAAQVMAVQDDFAQQIKDLKAVKTAENKTQTMLDAVVNMTTPLVAPLNDPQVDGIRQAVAKEMVQIQQQLVTTANNTNAVMPDLDQKISNIQKNFDAQIAALGKPTSLADDEVTALRQEVKDALASTKDARQKLQDSIKANYAVQNSLSQTVAVVQAEQNQIDTSMSDRISKLDSSTQATLAGSVQNIKTTIAENLASLNDQIKVSRAESAAAATKTQENLVAHSNQIALLESKLNLSNAARAALKQEADQTIARLKTEQNSLINDLQKRIDSEASLHAQLNDTAKKEINEIKAGQNNLLGSLKSQSDSNQLLKDQLEASISTLKSVQTGTESKVAALATGSGTLTERLQNIKSDLDSANQTIKTTAADSALARTELQKAINDLKSTQTLAQHEINNSFEAMDTQLRQTVGEVASVKSQIALDLAGLSGTIASVQASVSNILTAQSDLHLKLDAEAQANLQLRQQLNSSITRLEDAQTATQTEVNNLKTDVSSLKNSISDLANTQTTATTKINQLLEEAVNWRALPGTLQFSQDQFKQYQQQLATEFAAKASVLQQQFEDYKKQLDGTIQQLRTDTNAQLQLLKDEQAALKSQLQQAQQQLQQLQTVNITTPATTSPSSTTPATTTPTSTSPAITPTNSTGTNSLTSPTTAPTVPGL